MTALPQGLICFLFSDIEGSTIRWEREPKIMQAAVASHDALLRQIMADHVGAVFKTVGDAFCVAFATASDAIAAAIAAQKALAAFPWDARIAPLCVRMAVHTGEAEFRANDYFGPTLNRTARMLAVGHGGQILLSQTTVELVKDVLPRDVTLCDLETHILKDLQRPEHLFQISIAGLQSQFPPLKSLHHHYNNLPVQLTPFIGRQHDIQAVCHLLQQPHTRFITISGPGGIGKTRLSLQVAAANLSVFASGVYFVELDAINDDALVPHIIAQTLGVRESGMQALPEGIRKALQGRVLLVLDNFEHVIDASTFVFTLLSSCPDLVILVTSRSLLHIAGEREYRLQPLAVPSQVTGDTLRDIAQYAGIELFVQRAKVVKPDFQATSENISLITEICARLEGFPLAIELAAARLNILSLQALLKRLASRLQLLTSKMSHLPARQQTLRGAIDWSYHLLDNEEQGLLRSMAVFVDGCSLEAIGATAEPGQDVFDLVASLVSKSLLQQHEQADGELRFSLYESVREYAWELLLAQGEAIAIQQRHSEYFLQLTEEADTHLTGPLQETWLARLAQEYSNIRAALQWTLQAETCETALRFGAVLWRFWWMRGYLSEGRSWLERILTRTGNPPTHLLLLNAKVIDGASMLAMIQNDFTQAKTLANEAIAIGLQLDDALLMSEGYATLAKIAIDQGQISLGRSLYEQSLDLHRQVDDTRGIASILSNLGNAVLQQGEGEHAIRLHEESLELFRAVGDRWSIAAVLNNLGEDERVNGRYGQAENHFQESLKLRRELGYVWGIAATLANLATVRALQQCFAPALAAYAESLALFVDIGDDVGIAVCLDGIAQVASQEGLFTSAARLFGYTEALRERLAISIPPIHFTHYDSCVTMVRSQSQALESWARGRLLTQQSVIAEATAISNDALVQSYQSRDAAGGPAGMR